ncbi:putative methyltransferase Atu0936 [Marinobacterium lacunae]|uniref:Putative methyltransferase Atu0936 n=1 Tax=Marinobacterium lacunae TaxID=1232683 RepID=A0A081FYY5_9GAMM|nr:class I SAM-dependent methyltransferase [Marinobacterium lacunae]KEA63740.1 putative methyltransferase Atu0936 [Marinobacterium lacunae]
MQPEQIGQAYDQITHLWTSSQFNAENGIAQHLRALAFTDLRGAALDVGCGCNGRFEALLLEKGFSPEGVDISTRMIELARERYPELTFYHADICHWQPPRQYDFITAWDSLWHLPLHQQAPVMEKLFAALNPGGVCIFSAGGLDKPDEHHDAFMGPEVYYSTLGIPGFLKVIDEAGCICKHLEFDQHPELHLYFIVQRPAEVK